MTSHMIFLAYISRSSTDASDGSRSECSTRGRGSTDDGFGRRDGDDFGRSPRSFGAHGQLRSCAPRGSRGIFGQGFVKNRDAGDTTLGRRLSSNEGDRYSGAEVDNGGSDFDSDCRSRNRWGAESGDFRSPDLNRSGNRDQSVRSNDQDSYPRVEFHDNSVVRGGRNDGDGRDSGRSAGSTFDGRGASGLGGTSQFGSGVLRGIREFVFGGNSDHQRAPTDWQPLKTAMEDLLERDATNASRFENGRDAHVQVIGAPDYVEISAWQNSGLHPDLIENCTERCKYNYVRPIQAAAIPLILSGYDVLALTETGGGKTAAFVLPILHSILTMPERERATRRADAILALVVAPTRELAKQLFDSFRKHAIGTDVKCCVAYGQMPRMKNLLDIREGCDVLIGTSGRLMDFITNDNISTKDMRFLVLDEADMLLENTGESHLKRILNYWKFRKVEQRQTLLFSATYSNDVKRLAGHVLRENHILIKSSGGANSRVIQRFVQAEGINEKNDKLFDILEEQRDETADDERAVRTLVFVNSRQKADFIALTLTSRRIKAASINGHRPQDERERVVRLLEDGLLHVLVSTDVCQRGLDITGLDHVVIYDLPDGTTQEIRDIYIHRIGRTGRLHSGVATTFVDPVCDRKAAKPLIEVARQTGQEIPDWLERLSAESEHSCISNTFECGTGFGDGALELDTSDRVIGSEGGSSEQGKIMASPDVEQLFSHGVSDLTVED